MKRNPFKKHRVNTLNKLSHLGLRNLAEEKPIKHNNNNFKYHLLSMHYVTIL